MVTGKNYELIEHTADIGIRVKARDLKGIFSKAAQALFDIIAERKNPAAPRAKKKKIRLSAQNLDELLVNWLNELLSLSSAEETIFYDFKFSKLSDTQLQAVATGDDSVHYKAEKEIKAATYHGLSIKRASSGWQAELIFDV